VAFSPSGTRLYSSSRDGVVIEWDVPTGRPLRTLPPLAHPATRLAVVATASGGEALICASSTITVIDLATLTPVAQMAGHVSPVSTIAVAADGAAFATGAIEDRFVNIWAMPVLAAAASAAAAGAGADKKAKKAAIAELLAASTGADSALPTPAAVVAVALDSPPQALSLYSSILTSTSSASAAAAGVLHLAAVTRKGAASLWDLSAHAPAFSAAAAGSAAGKKGGKKAAAGAAATTPTVSAPGTILTVAGLATAGEAVEAMSAFTLRHVGGKPGKKTVSSTALPSLPEGALAAAQLLGGARVLLARHSAIQPQFDLVAYTGAAAAAALDARSAGDKDVADEEDDEAEADEEESKESRESAVKATAAAVRAGAFVPALTLSAVAPQHLSAAAANGAAVAASVTVTGSMTLKRRRGADGEYDAAVTTGTAAVAGPGAHALVSATSALDMDADVSVAAAAGTGSVITAQAKRARLAAATSALTQSLALRVQAMDAEIAARARSGRAAAAAALAGPAGAGGAALRSGSLTVALTQALKAGDDTLLEQCLAAGAVGGARARRSGASSTISITVARVPAPLVLRLVSKLVSRLQSRVNRAGELLPWVRECLRQHTAYLMTVPELGAELATLYRIVEARAEARARLLPLQGRLDLLLSQVTAAPGAALEAVAPVTVYSEAADILARQNGAGGDSDDDEDEDDDDFGSDGEMDGGDSAGDDDDEEEEEDVEGEGMNDDE
jgi:hypothetical protein